MLLFHYVTGSFDSEHSVYPTEGSYHSGLRVHNVMYGMLTQYEIVVRYSPTLHFRGGSKTKGW